MVEERSLKDRIRKAQEDDEKVVIAVEELKKARCHKLHSVISPPIL